MELQVYVDTNVYLRLLATQPAITDDMSKFLALCQNASLELLLPQQTEEEYFANREDVVARAVKELRKSASLGGFPPLVQNHDLGPEATALRKNLSAKIQIVEGWYAEAAKKKELPFDGWFDQLRAAATKLKSDEATLSRARERAAMHLPPGKGEALGDRLIWESLLEAGDILCDLHVISTDNEGYRCPLNAGNIRSRLREDWGTVNLGSVILHETLERFLQDASSTSSFQRAAEIGRAIWTLNHQPDEALIMVAAETIEREMTCLSLRQARMISRAARSYYDRVFMTEGTFDRMIGEFYRLYAKHLTKEEEEAVRPAVAANEEIGTFIAANANHR